MNNNKKNQETKTNSYDNPNDLFLSDDIIDEFLNSLDSSQSVTATNDFASDTPATATASNEALTFVSANTDAIVQSIDEQIAENVAHVSNASQDVNAVFYNSLNHFWQTTKINTGGNVPANSLFARDLNRTIPIQFSATEDEAINNLPIYHKKNINQAPKYFIFNRVGHNYYLKLDKLFYIHNTLHSMISLLKCGLRDIKIDKSRMDYNLVIINEENLKKLLNVTNENELFPSYRILEIRKNINIPASFCDLNIDKSDQNIQKIENMKSILFKNYKICFEAKIEFKSDVGEYNPAQVIRKINLDSSTIKADRLDTRTFQIRIDLNFFKKIFGNEALKNEYTVDELRNHYRKYLQTPRTTDTVPSTTVPSPIPMPTLLAFNHLLPVDDEVLSIINNKRANSEATDAQDIKKSKRM